MGGTDENTFGGQVASRRGTSVQQISNGADTSRISALSDGIMAFAITLLVLELKVPDLEAGSIGLFEALVRQWPNYLAYFTSFWSIGLAWIIHHNMFTHIRRWDHTLLLINLVFLLVIALVPYPTAIVAAYLQQESEQRNAMIFYSGTWLMLAVMINLLWWYATSRRLVDPAMDPLVQRRIARRYLLGPPLYLLALGIASISFVAAATFYILIGLIYTLPGPGSPVYEPQAVDDAGAGS